jgi:hypothetical protein
VEGEMTVEVSAQSIAALRAQLSGNSSEHQRLVREFGGRDDKVAYSALVNAAFLEAVNRRFSRKSQTSDVIDYVADVRSRIDEAADAVDPRVGEQIIFEVLGRGTADGIDSRTSATARMFLLTALIADERLDVTALNQFVAKATKTADYLLNSRT